MLKSSEMAMTAVDVAFLQARDIQLLYLSRKVLSKTWEKQRQGYTKLKEENWDVLWRR